MHDVSCRCPCRDCRIGTCGRCRRCTCGCGVRRQGCGKCWRCRSGRSDVCPIQGVSNLHAIEYYGAADFFTFNRIVLLIVIIVLLYLAFKG